MSHHDEPQFTSGELDGAITRSRAMLEVALDALVHVISETTGRPPERARVRFTSLFWLMHLCDRVVYESMCGIEPRIPHLDHPVVQSRSLRSRLLPLVGTRQSAVGICEPYLKLATGREFVAAVTARRTMHWRSLPVPRIRDVEASGVRSRIIAGSGDEGELVRRIAGTAPVELVEAHHELAAWSDATTEPRLRILYTANGHQSSMAFRHHSFAQRRLGTRLAIHQHGGGYGIDQQHLGEDHDVSLADSFFSWGWSNSGQADKVRPLPTALPDHHRGATSDHYLLMSLPVTSHFYRLQPFIVPSHVGRAVDESVSFVGGLTEGTRLRVRSSGRDSFPIERLSVSTAVVTIDDGKESGSMAASRARLVVHNYLGTSWLETLAMNVPTVCFFDPTTYLPREAAQPYVDALIRVGILHHSGRDAARFVNSLNGDPSGWWDSSDVQEARRAFVARYANFSEDWLDAWMTEFERMLAE